MTFVYFIVALVMALTLHEMMHALTSDWLGDTTARQAGRLSLNPLAHIDPVMTVALPVVLFLLGGPILAAAKPVPFNPWAVRWGKWGAALVAVAGPLTNLFLAVFFAMWLRFIPLSNGPQTFFLAVVTINAALFIFNMIPFPPLDGSRVLYAVAPESVRDVMDRIERMGVAAVMLILFVGYRFIAPALGALVGGLVKLLIPGLPPF